MTASAEPDPGDTASDHGADPESPVASETRDDAPTGLFGSAPLEQAMGVYLPATVAFRLINFGRIILLSWTMLQHQFGMLSMILLVVNVLTPLCSFGLCEAVARYVPQHEARGTLGAFARHSFFLLLAIAAVGVAPVVIFARPLGEFFFAWIFADSSMRAEFGAGAGQLARVSAVVIALLIVYFYLLSVLKALRMFKALSLMEIMHGSLFLVLSLSAIAAGRLSAVTLTVLYGVSLTAPILCFGWGVRRTLMHWASQQAPIDAGGTSRTLLRYAAWAAMAGGVWQTLVYYPQWYLGKVQGSEAVAIFGAMRQIGQFILIGAVAVVAVVAANVTKTWETRGRDAADRQWSLAIRGCGIGLFLGCAVIALGKHWIIALFRDDYADGAAILPLQALFFLLAAYLAFLSIHFQLIEKTRHLFLPWAIGVAANVVAALRLTGPGLVETQSTAIWQGLAPWTSRIFTIDFSGPRGLSSASWCGVLAVAAALLTCIVLLRAEKRRLDRGTLLVIAAAFLLATNAWILTAGTALVVLLAVGTDLIFTTDERQRIAAYARTASRNLPFIGTAGGGR